MWRGRISWECKDHCGCNAHHEEGEDGREVHFDDDRLAETTFDLE